MKCLGRFALLCFLGLSHAWAGTTDELDNTSLRFVGMLSAGPLWHESGKAQTITMSAQNEQYFTAHSSSQGFAEGEIFLGVQKNATPDIITRVGVMLGTTGNANLSGLILQNGDPDFTNFSYHYRVQHSVVAAQGFVLFDVADKAYGLMPWVNASLGVGFNRAHGYSSLALIYEVIPSQNFTNNTETAFSYTFGAGAQKVIDNHWQLGVGYEFSDWGKSELGRAAGQNINSGPKLNHLYTNGFLVNLTYIA